MVNGKLSSDFFKEEVRSGYLVSEQMKKVWAIELDMVQKFVEVCEKYDLEYFMDGGTLLGAVRHKGFIPWDDDIDLIMPRKDYNKLLEIAPREFKSPYFLQSTMTENGFFRTHAQLRNSNTTGFIPIDRNKDINRGIFMDIFVLDGVADNCILRFMHKFEIQVNKKILAYRYDRNYAKLNLPKKVLYYFSRLFFKVIPFKVYFNRFNKKVLARYSNKKTKRIGDLTLKWRKNVQWPSEWYDGYYLLPFENLKLRAPMFYKDILAWQYGDYMKIPENIHAANGRVHETITFDPDTPYKLYFDRLKKQ